jgi:inhibitor of KinA sporulation pathway (predicted exonuclease)/predicted RNA-binding Zn-ribbon protein involved in translation (DUF1610 family)
LLDLEWNSAYSGAHKKFINEIIEIGAVKLDEDLREVDCFRQTIRSGLTRRLSGRFKRLTNITNEEMRAGVSLSEGLRRYGEWVGPDDITMTWSNTDLYVLLENCRLFTEWERPVCVGRYVDVQRFVQEEMARRGLIADAKQQISLGRAAELFGIDVAELDLHRAQTDSRLCCLLLQRTFDPIRLAAEVQDTRAADYYDRLTFKSYVISDIHSPDIDREALKFCCEDCGAPARRRGKWIFKSRSFRAPFRCEACGKEFIGRAVFKKTYDGVTVKHTTRPMPEEELQSSQPPASGEAETAQAVMPAQEAARK